jgi:hypothetical protein
MFVSTTLPCQLLTRELAPLTEVESAASAHLENGGDSLGDGPDDSRGVGVADAHVVSLSFLSAVADALRVKCLESASPLSLAPPFAQSLSLSFATASSSEASCNHVSLSHVSLSHGASGSASGSASNGANDGASNGANDGVNGNTAAPRPLWLESEWAAVWAARAAKRLCDAGDLPGTVRGLRQKREHARFCPARSFVTELSGMLTSHPFFFFVYAQTIITPKGTSTSRTSTSRRRWHRRDLL